MKYFLSTFLILSVVFVNHSFGQDVVYRDTVWIFGTNLKFLF